MGSCVSPPAAEVCGAAVAGGGAEPSAGGRNLGTRAGECHRSPERGLSPRGDDGRAELGEEPIS